MPSPSEMHLRLMGEIYRKFALDLKNFPTDAEIHERVGKFGPFIHCHARNAGTEAYPIPVICCTLHANLINAFKLTKVLSQSVSVFQVHRREKCCCM